MKKAVLFLIVIFLSSGLFAQDNKVKNEGDKPSSKEKKEAKALIRKKQFIEKAELLESRKFVLEADYLVTADGSRHMASSDLDFIIVDSTRAVIQSGENVGIGYNNVGGITAKGNITSWKVERNEKKLSLTVRMNVNTSLGLYTVFMYSPSNGKTTATVSANFITNKADFVGKLVKPEDSIAFEGWSF